VEENSRENTVKELSRDLLHEQGGEALAMVKLGTGKVLNNHTSIKRNTHVTFQGALTDKQEKE